MKIQLLAFSAILATFTATSVTADDNLKVDNDAKNSVAIGGTGYFPNNGAGFGYYGESWSNTRALAGSVMVKGCDCDDADVTLTNTSDGALAVGKGISGSIVKR